MKNVKKNAILFKLFWYKVFVHWKLKLLNLLMDSVLIIVRLTWFNRLIIEWTRKHNSLSVVDLPGMLKKNFCSKLNFPLGFLGFLSIKKNKTIPNPTGKGVEGCYFIIIIIIIINIIIIIIIIIINIINIIIIIIIINIIIIIITLFRHRTKWDNTGNYRKQNGTDI